VVISTQIEPACKLVNFLDLLRQLNNVWLDLSKDFWLYISFNYLVQAVKSGEVGSSTMPHKVNPINFENAEGNLELSNSFLAFFSNKLPLSRLQRDLSDSTVKRNLGVAFGYQSLATKSLLKGLGKIRAHVELMKKEVDKHPEMLAEAIQLYWKKTGEKAAYEKIKVQARGKKPSWKKLTQTMSSKQQQRLDRLRKQGYIGLAKQLVGLETEKIKKDLSLK